MKSFHDKTLVRIVFVCISLLFWLKLQQNEQRPTKASNENACSLFIKKQSKIDVSKLFYISIVTVEIQMESMKNV